jgi:hypothetical protein
VDTIIGHPEPNGSTNPRLNIYLYEAHFDPHMKNLPLDEGQTPPLWLVLKYLLTSFDGDGKSSTIAAHKNLGLGLRSLQQLAYLPESTSVALQPNPEPLKITFEETNAELLSKIMQGADDKYHFSMSFQVRPVMIATGEPPSYSLLVGVDYVTAPPPPPPTIIGEKQIGLNIFATMGPVLTEIQPTKFDVNDKVVIKGSYLDQSDLSISLDGEELAVSNQKFNSLECTIAGNIPDGAVLSAGSHPLTVVKKLTGTRTRSSNILISHLRPTVNKMTVSDLTNVGGKVAGKIKLEGLLLGTEKDDIFIALFKDGATVKMFDTPFTYSSNQKTLTLEIVNEEAVDPDKYLVILRVNGQQARKSFEAELIV